MSLSSMTRPLSIYTISPFIAHPLPTYTNFSMVPWKIQLLGKALGPKNLDQRKKRPLSLFLGPRGPLRTPLSVRLPARAKNLNHL